MLLYRDTHSEGGKLDSTGWLPVVADHWGGAFVFTTSLRL
jgi:hypothetical protein